MSKIEGGCLCGAVRYTCAAEPVMTAICQCTHCQRQSGSAFSVNVGIPKGSLQYTGDIPATFEDIGDQRPSRSSPVLQQVRVADRVRGGGNADA